LDVLLLEDGLAGFVGDAGGPVLPGDLVVGMDVRAGEAALEGQATDRGLAVSFRAIEGGPVWAGVAVLGLGGGPVGLRWGLFVHDRTAVAKASRHVSRLRRR